MTLEQGLADFLAHLGIEKNASPQTVKSYREDLSQALQFVRDLTQQQALAPEQWTTRHLRAFVAWLHGQKYAKSTVARRLAAVRAFGKFLCRQGTLESACANSVTSWPRSTRPRTSMSMMRSIPPYSLGGTGSIGSAVTAILTTCPPTAAIPDGA